MLSKWEVFEVEACNLLNSICQGHPIHFVHMGGSNSNVGDIEGRLNQRSLFYVEAKLSPCQSGQFVIYDYDDHFIFSDKNVVPYTVYAQQIIEYLNNNFDRYNDVRQSGIPINCNPQILINWVISHYHSKNSFFVITSNQLGGNKSIIPIEEINQYFSVSAVLRRKKSGSRHVPINEREEALQKLQEHLKDSNFTVVRERIKTIICSNNPKLQSKSQRYFDGTYYLTEKSVGYYEIKKLSTTNNINVVFSLEYTGPKHMFGFKKFEKYLQSFM